MLLLLFASRPFPPKSRPKALFWSSTEPLNTQRFPLLSAQLAAARRLPGVLLLAALPRQAAEVEHDLVELLVVAINAVLVGAGTFVKIESRAREKLD